MPELQFFKNVDFCQSSLKVTKLGKFSQFFLSKVIFFSVFIINGRTILFCC